ncbi:hypothetical protein [Nonomuraea sp. NPDC050202]|jgi:dienelactone hydrolase|uniref:hypothetical protein n=1 Tax=Nonomuraea sp. NPDC050202 TaxID=3155035 RepID=UPI0033DF230F
MTPIQRYLAEEVALDHVDGASFDGTGQRDDADAAARAYGRVLDWFGRHLA